MSRSGLRLGALLASALLLSPGTARAQEVGAPIPVTPRAADEPSPEPSAVISAQDALELLEQTGGRHLPARLTPARPGAPPPPARPKPPAPVRTGERTIHLDVPEVTNETPLFRFTDVTQREAEVPRTTRSPAERRAAVEAYRHSLAEEEEAAGRTE